MSDTTHLLPPPAACVRWCDEQHPDHTVLDDASRVDLDWWNHRLAIADLPVRIRARDLDGHVVHKGTGFIQRTDLRPDGPLLAPADVRASSRRLGLLYLCAAWLREHPLRCAAKRFPLVFNAYGIPGRSRTTQVDEFLRHCLSGERMPRRISRGGWPPAPHLGVALRATIMWAAGAHTCAGRRPQLIDQYGVNTLVREGWLGKSTVSGFTVREYDVYVGLVDRWAGEIGTAPELVEMWLVHEWRRRRDDAVRSPEQLPLF